MASSLLEPCSLCRKPLYLGDNHPECFYCRRTSGIKCLDDCQFCAETHDSIKINNEKRFRKRLQNCLYVHIQMIFILIYLFEFNVDISVLLLLP